MNLYKCGTHVKINMGLIEGMITAICIRFNAVTYEISYFTEGVQKTIWMNEAEFTPVSKCKRENIGFKQL